jgi:hypothetical protein
VAAGDDDLIAERMKGLSETAADAGAAASNENGVAAEFHESRRLLLA